MAGNAEQAGSSLKRRSPDEVRVVRASGSVINYEVNHMLDSNTSKTNVIPFEFKGRSVRAISIDGEPWFVAADVAAALEYRIAGDMTRNLDDDEKGTQIVRTPGGEQEMLVINESGLYSAILRSRKAEAKRFKKWVTAEVLPAIRKHGRYSDDSNKMATLVNDVIGVSGANLVGGVISQKVSVLPVGVQRQARHKLHAILHTRFNVPRTELIPADKLDTACQYIGAYTLEGEWLQKQQDLKVEPGAFRRYLVSFDHNGKQQMSGVPAEACVMTVNQMLSAISDPEFPVSTEELFDFMAAVNSQLKRRAAWQATQLKRGRVAA